MPDDDIDEGFQQRLPTEQARVPPSEHDRQLRTKTPNHGGNLDRIPDHRAGKQRNAEAYTVGNFVRNDSAVVAVDCAIDDARLVPGGPERSCQAEQSQRRPQYLPGVWR